MSDPFLGEIRLVGFNFEPRGWAYCNGQLLSISQNNALFALLGTQYGGDGQVTFALPDLRGRAALHQFQHPGGSNRTIGETGGQESVTLLQQNLPPHTHPGIAASAQTTDRPSAGMAPAPGGSYGPADSGVAMAPPQVVGNGIPVNNMQPYLVMNYVIALEGIFPSRN